ncbi:MAG: AEC family transporter [Candidatus Cloacimonadaceae bacterium]|jgi:predicted permease|nr:AEC family transporter [Candidatus Cloacimonadota bacterium]MDY0128299.1 AEC family transporter [Candidatus Cloacimonadaceae bacterium]MCB5254685.1 AEC family transporter [Candidatus Cloacimonadota bacterium]MCK9179064.1 AEC family transporter [Candidatus Cloacimonadota bacterium]MCK9243501.1 AEC family transporter [Candidatus Cloacimonadota bacterium]
MNPFVEKVIPLILAFFIGVLVKRLKLMSKKDAHVLLKFVLSVSLPALTIIAINNVVISADMLLIPFLAMAVVLIMYLISQLANRLLKLPRAMFGSFLIGTMIMNTAYALPFFHAAFGDEGLARASLFDIGNTFMIFTFTYYNAVKYGDNSHSDRIDWKKFLRLPPLWAMLIAFSIKIVGISLPPLVINSLSLVGLPTTALVMIALGLYFEPRLKNMGKAFLAIFIRMGIGLAVGYLLSLMLGLRGLTATTVTVCAALPIGFNTLIFSDLENMDREFAATMVSFSIIIALFYLPLLIYIFG